MRFVKPAVANVVASRRPCARPSEVASRATTSKTGATGPRSSPARALAPGHLAGAALVELPGSYRKFRVNRACGASTRWNLGPTFTFLRKKRSRGIAGSRSSVPTANRDGSDGAQWTPDRQACPRGARAVRRRVAGGPTASNSSDWRSPSTNAGTCSCQPRARRAGGLDPDRLASGTRGLSVEGYTD